MTTVGDLKRLLALLPDETTVWMLAQGPDVPVAIELCRDGRNGPTTGPLAVPGERLALLAYPATQDFHECCDALLNLPPAPGPLGVFGAGRRCLRCGHDDNGTRGWAVLPTGLTLCQECIVAGAVTHPARVLHEDFDLDLSLEEEDDTDRYRTHDGDAGMSWEVT